MLLQTLFLPPTGEGLSMYDSDRREKRNPRKGE
jgi:hypothetical protein